MPAHVAPGEGEPFDEAILQPFGAFPQLVELFHTAADLAGDDNLDKAPLALEPAKNGHSRDGGPARYVFHRGATDAVLGELVKRRRRNPVKERVLAEDGSHFEDLCKWRHQILCYSIFH